MGTKRVYKKPEPTDVQGKCVKCRVNKQKLKSKGRYRALCESCHNRRHGINLYVLRHQGREYTLKKKPHCEDCGFVAAHPCQLDVDHIDGNHGNNSDENLRTLCANCHRLKTQQSRDWDKRAAA